MLEDWHYAEICFASDILKGEGELWKQIGSDVTHENENQRWKCLSTAGFQQLQQIWLSDVIRFHAYVKWVERGADPMSDTKGDYREACREFSQRVGNSSIKFDGKGAYDGILGYLTSNYIAISGYRIDCEKPGARERIEAKARRIYHVTGCRDDLANWVRAESYVGKFYNNVIAAISGDVVSKSELCEAFALSEDPRFGCSITDCFEAMVLIYYVRNFNLPDVWTGSFK